MGGRGACFATLSPVMTRRLASAAVALCAVAALSACSVSSPVQTDVPYNAADGVAVDLGPVQLRGLVVVAEAKDAPGALVGQVVNNGDEPTTVTFQDGAGGTASVEAPAHGSVTLGSAGTSVTLEKVTVPPGANVPLAVNAKSGGTAAASVPVVPRSGYYESIAVPSASAS